MRLVVNSCRPSAVPVHCSAVIPPQVSTPAQPAKLAVFVSGGGSNFKAIHAATQSTSGNQPELNASVVACVSDVPGCGGWRYAQDHGIATLVYPGSTKKGIEGLSAPDLVAALKEELGVQYVLLAGFLKIIPPELCQAYKRAILNIHPALLPAFGGKGYYGSRVHAAVVASGARYSGPTIHFVDEEYDTGPILAQRVVPVYPTDTPAQLSARVLVQEHLLYPEAVKALVEGRITWREDGVPVVWSAH